MGPASKKRKLHPAGNAPPSKRPKGQAAKVKAKAKSTWTWTWTSKSNQTSKKARASASTPGRALDPASLAWQSVGEDFGALQVIEGVDVVRNGDSVKFVASTTRDAADSSGSRVSDHDDDDNDDHDDNDNKDEDEDEDEYQQRNGDEEESFEGFGDSDLEVESVDPHQAGRGEARLARKTVEEANKAIPILAANEGKEEADTPKQRRKAKEKRANAKEQQLDTAAQALHQPSPRNGNGNGNNANSFEALADDDDEEQDGGVDVAAWVSMGLSPAMMAALSKLKFAKPTIIQEKAIPDIVAGQDVIGKAQTGSGKTLAFGIPIVERWLEMRDEGDPESMEMDEQEDDDGQTSNSNKTAATPLAVILSPTRELAKQLGDHLKALCSGLPTGPYICVVTGGLSIHKQRRQLERADIVIGTPGRLWEVLEGDGGLQDRFAQIRFLVVDEADRLLTAGQFKEVEDILGALDKRDPEADEDEDQDEEDEGAEGDEDSARQTLVFSATFDKNLQTKLAGKGRKRIGGAGASDDDKMEYLMKCLKFRRDPKFIDVNPISQMADGLREGLIECGAMEKDLYLYALLLLNPGRRTLVFTNSISAARRLTPLLQNLRLAALPLHSQMAQKARLRSLERFTAAAASGGGKQARGAGGGAVLVATDVAARGLDIPNVDQVIHYHVPRAADAYIHRSGRTARGDKSGVSVLLCSPEEVLPTRRLAAKVHADQGQAPRRKNEIHFIESLPIDRRLVSRLKPRVDLSKRLADAALAKEKARGADNWLRNAAEDLGVDYDPDEFEQAGGSGGGAGGGRGGGRKRKEKEARELTKAEMGALRANLGAELDRRVNLGVSERYITGGRVNVAELLKQRESATVGGLFLGGEGLGLDL